MRIRPTLLIGLGRQGSEVVLALREALAGGLLPVASLTVDTDRNFEVEPPPGHEHLFLHIDDPSYLTGTARRGQFPHLERWWPQGLASLPTLKEGSAGQRPYGRLAFFHFYERVKASIKTLHARVRDPDLPVVPGTQVELDMATDVYLVSSTGGGTGGGMLLDLAFLVKHQLREHGCNLNGYLLFPHGSNSGAANTYALLKEVNHYSYGNRLYEAEWTPGQPTKVPIPAFDQCYLLEEERPLAAIGSILTDLCEGEFSEQKRSLRVNLKQYASRTFDVDHGHYVQQFVCRYFSLGQSVLVFPYPAISEWLSTRFCREVAQSWLTGSEAGESSLSTVLSRSGLAEQQVEHADGICQELVFAGERIAFVHRLQLWGQELLRDVEARKLATPSGRLLDFLEQKTATLQSQLLAEPKAGENATGYLCPLQYRAEQCYRRALNLLESALDSYLDRRGLDVKGLVPQLDEFTAGLKTSMRILQKQQAHHSEQHRLRANEALKILADLSRAQSRPNWDGRRGILARYLVQCYLDAKLDFGRKTGALAALVWERACSEAIDVCRRLIAHVEEVVKPRLSELKTDLEELGEQWAVTQLEQRAALAAERPLAYWSDVDQLQERLYRFYVHNSARLLELRKSEKRLLQLDRAELAAHLQHTGDWLFSRVSIDFHPVRLLVSELPAQDRERLYKDMLEESLPRIRTGKKNHVFELQPQQMMRLVGLPGPHPEATASERQEFDADIAQLRRDLTERAPGIVNFATMQSTDRILLHQEVGGFPLNFVEGLQPAREHYLSEVMAGQAVHVDPLVDPAEDFQIYSAQEYRCLEDAMKAYVLGCIFWLIKDSQLTRDAGVRRLTHSEVLRERLLRESLEHWEQVRQGDLPRIALIGSLLALQKKAVYGTQWGKVLTAGELSSQDRLEVAIISQLETELQMSPVVQRMGQDALEEVLRTVPEAMLAEARRNDGRYVLPQPGLRNLKAV